MTTFHNGPHDEMRRLIQGVGPEIDRVIEDARRRLDSTPVTNLRIFSQTVDCPWDVELSLTAELACHMVRREFHKVDSADSDRVDEALAVLREHARKIMVAIVESATHVVVYWRWMYAYTLCTEVDRQFRTRSRDDWRFHVNHSWVPDPVDILCSGLGPMLVDLNPAYSVEAEAVARARRAEVEAGERDRRLGELAKAVKEARALAGGG